MDSLAITPEGLEIANKYLEKSSISETAADLCIDETTVSEWLNKVEVKRYIDSIYLDLGYRNRFKLGNLLDTIIESKLEEAEESEMYSDKDLVDILHLAHKMRMDEIKAQQTSIANQTNIQINSENSNIFGSGNYGALMQKLIGEDNGKN